jgi:hypothetical protein
MITRVGVYDQSATMRGGRRGGEAGLPSVSRGMCCGGLERVRYWLRPAPEVLGGGGGTHGRRTLPVY